MLRKSHKRRAAHQPPHAVVFAALGDKTRLALVERLSGGRSASILELTADAPITRQAVTKHLRVLEDAGIVRSKRAGRETRFALHLAPLHGLQVYLDRVGRQWDETLGRLKAFVEE